MRRFQLESRIWPGAPDQGKSWQQNMAAAEKLFGQALQDPKLSVEDRRQALFYLSAARSWQNRPADALKTSLTWLRENPKHADRPHVMFYAAWYLERLGRVDEAQAMRGQIRSHYPKSPWADHAKSYMDTIDNRVKARGKRSRKSVRAPGRVHVELQWPMAALPAKSADK